MPNEGCKCLAEKLPDCLRPGKQGITTAHKPLIERNPKCSIDLDDCLEAQYPSDARWDYICIGDDVTGFGVEVHAVKDSEVESIIAKRSWAIARLSGLCPEISIAEWFWVPPPGGRIDPPDKKSRRL